MAPGHGPYSEAARVATGYATAMWFLLACVAEDGSKPVETAAVGDSSDSIPTTGTTDTDSETGPTDSSETADSPTTEDSGTPATTWRSALYPEDWTPDFTASDGRFLHDFSYAGYRAGEAEIPQVPATRFDVTDYGADATGSADSTAAFQAGIAAASAASGGTVWVPAGTFRLDGTLSVTTSGVVIAGEGSTSRVYFTRGVGMAYSAHVTFAGAVSVGPDLPLVADAPNRATSMAIGDPSSLAVGDEVHIGWTITDDFVAEHGMTDTWVEFNGAWRAFFRRTVTAIDATTGIVTFDVPLRYPALARDGASVRKVSGYLTECGLVDLALSNVNDWDTAWAESQAHLALFSGVKDCWVSGVETWESPLSTDGKGKHLMSSGIEVLDSRRVTIANTSLAASQHRGDGGNGYLYEISRSNEVLTVDSAARDGRHNFIQNWDFGTSGCVWLRTTSDGSRAYYADWDPVGWQAYSEFHHSLAMANLIDHSEASDGWQGVNRHDESSGAGHAVTQSVYWNLSGGGYLRSLQYGDGYVIGTTDMDVHVDPAEWDWANSGEGTEPEDWTEGLDEGATIDPPSLYEDQLRLRLERN